MTVAALVLLSGGIDSAATLAMYRRRSASVSALFVDYGQASASLERAASARVAQHYAASLAEVRCAGLGTFAGGYVRGRNALLLHVALTVAPFEEGQVAIGIHAGTPHVDCSPRFVDDMQRSFDLYCNGRVRVVAPFVDHDKRAVIAFCRENDVPIALTYSCQLGVDPPCRSCMSCLDRRALDVE